MRDGFTACVSISERVLDDIRWDCLSSWIL